MKLDINQIITQVIVTLMTSLVIGAFIIVWKAAMSVDTKISNATNDIKQNQTLLMATQDALVEEIHLIKKAIFKEEKMAEEDIHKKINSRHSELKRLH